LKKRTKKLLLLQARFGAESATANKSFLFLFFKKEELFSFGDRRYCSSQEAIAYVPPAAG